MTIGTTAPETSYVNVMNFDSVAAVAVTDVDADDCDDLEMFCATQTSRLHGGWD